MGGTGATGSVAGSGVPGSGAAAGSGQSGSVAGSGAGGTGASGSVSATDGGTVNVNWPSQACQTQTAAMLAKMSKMQKAQQMVMLESTQAALGMVSSNLPGAVFAGGSGGSNMDGPGNQSAGSWAAFTGQFRSAAAGAALQIPLLYGLDVVHGNNGATNAVIMPQNHGLGATHDLALVQAVYNVAAQESLAVGINWTFGPFSGVVWDYRWGRVYESFGGDPVAVSQMVQAAVLGFQGPNGLGSGSAGVGGAVACSKHFAGDGQMGPPSATGVVVDRGQINVDTPTMMTWGVNPYIPALQAGLGCIMVSDAHWNGASITEDKQLITMILKGQLGFKGFVITDWNAGNTGPAVGAGVDMFMHPGGGNLSPEQAESNTINIIANLPAGMDSRIDDAVTRILNVKCQAGQAAFAPGDPSTVGSGAHRAIARKAVAESMVVLQNTGNALPLGATAKVFVTGSGANSMRNQCGGWTITWQGNGDRVTGGTTIQAAVNKVSPTVGSMAAADTVVVVLSEPPYAEGAGDSATLDTLPAGDFTLLDQAKAAGKKVVAIVMSGRPVLLHDLTKADAWIAAWLPGSEGDGVADILFGKVKPTGKLPHHWPASDAQARWGGVAVGSYMPMFKIGDGLTW